MPYIPASDANWLDEAWRLLDVVQAMPRHPPGGMLKVLQQHRTPGDYWAAEPARRQAIELLQLRISLYLAHQFDVVHKVKPEPRNGRRRIYKLKSITVKTVRALRALVTQDHDLKLSSEEQYAFLALECLAQVLDDACVSDGWKRLLPLMIASISGKSSSHRARINAKRPRNTDRRGSLARAVADERRKDRHAKCWEVLDRLTGGDVVQKVKDNRIFYWKDGGKLTDIGLDRFETVFSQQNPSTG